ncbi:MAG: DUF2341 domain-containing protein [Nitrospiraceae bacterium]|nr:MAG: DUF2341 domain-containing protein [Nitrospiraceae bacterium]
MESDMKKVLIIFLCLLSLTVSSRSALAATVTWTGGVTNNLASNSSNWSSGIIPQYGDHVIFDASSSNDCTWDLTVTLASFSIMSSYAGVVAITSETDLTIDTNIIPPVPPTAPSLLSATAISSSQINLSWTDNSNTESGYKIERKIGTGGTYTQVVDIGKDVIMYFDTGLTKGTTYYYKIRAYNSFGDSDNSNDTYATTLAVDQPSATTSPATNIGGYTATLNAIVNPHGSGTTVNFQWGTDLSYGNTTSTQSAGSGTSNVNITANLTDLLPGTTYHYRITATNAGGITYGDDMSFTTPNWYDANWLYRQQIVSKQLITVASNITPSSTLTNFPVLIKLSDQANPIFNKALANGDDIVFTLSDGTTRLNHEIESYNNAAGNMEFVAWVKIPTLSSSSNTNIYMYYGNNNASDQQSPAAVWDNNYKGVWHLKEGLAGTGTVDLYKDSTVNNNHGDDYTSATGQSGKVGSGQEFDAVDDYVDVMDEASLDIADAITVEAWVYLKSTSGYRTFLCKGDDRYVIYFNPGTSIPVAGIYRSDYENLPYGSSINLNQWNHLSFTYDKNGGANNFITYINGVLSSSTTKTGPIGVDDHSLSIGACKYWGMYSVYFNGFIDEVRISNIARSSDWIKTSYNTQNSPQSYLTFGTEENYRNTVPPTAVTNTATNISGSTATINSTVNPNGYTTTAYFQWGTTTSYGNTTTTQAIGSGTNSVSVTANLTGLSSNTTYHYRVVATNPYGTSNGDDVSFTTNTTITWTGSVDTFANNPANWTENRVPRNGDAVIFNGAINCTWNLNVIPLSLTALSAYTGTVTLNYDLSIRRNLNVLGGTLNLNDKTLNVDGYILIGYAGTLNATSSIITVKGDWANWGNFISGTSTVILDGTNQTIYGNTTFYKLIKIVTSADTLYFEAGSTQTISNTLTLQGTNGNLLLLRSTSDGYYWYINPLGSRNVSFVNIKDMYNKNVVHIPVTDSIDSGNNNKVSFGGSECSCLEKELIIQARNDNGRLSW